MRAPLLTIAVFAVFAAALLSPTQAVARDRAAAMGMSGGHDLDALWAQAQARYDLARNDAILLLESRAVTLDAHGGQTTRVHRVVWIGTSIGIGAYADLRVPWNEAGATLTVEKLRTWRDGRWWPDPVEISETAIVHTLPFALARAHDYTTMRETMLLHDGVELPCIMETAYTITEPAPAIGAAACGVFVIPQRDPAVLTVYTVTVPAAVAVSHQGLHGAPQPAVLRQDAHSYVWTVEQAPALAWPPSERPLQHESAVVWTTWPEQAHLAARREAFDAAALATQELLQAARPQFEATAGFHDEILAATRFVSEAIRAIGYDDRPWRFALRPAERTWASGYGHTHDRAAVLAALLGQRGFAVQPLYLLDAPPLPDVLAAAAAENAGELFLLVESAARGDARLIDVKSATVHGPHHRPGSLRVVLASGAAAGSGLAASGGHAVGRLEVFLALEPAADGDGWRGRGEIAGYGQRSLHDEVVAAAGGLDALATRLVAGVLAGATVREAAVRRLETAAGVIAFELDVPAAKDEAGNKDGEQRLSVGAPRGGVRDALPGDVHLADGARGSPVLLASATSQVVTVRLRLQGSAARHLPPPRRLANSAGVFALNAAVEGGWLVYRRELDLARERIAAADWPDLRALLLEEADPANRTISVVKSDRPGG